MPLKEGAYIIECVPQEDEIREGKLLYDFFNMLLPKNRIDFHETRTFDDFHDALLKNNYQVIHISCHGGKDDEGKFCMFLPDDDPIYASQFLETSHLKGRNIVITGCSLGRGDFALEFLERTQAESLIAPMNPIESADSAMWCVNFYNHLLRRKSFSFDMSYKYMRQKKLNVKGAMMLWGK